MKKSITKLFGLLILFALPGLLLSIDMKTIKAELVPDYSLLQGAGNLGWRSLSFGYICGKKGFYETDFGFGYTPARLGGRDIHQFNWKNRYLRGSMEITERIKVRHYIGLYVTVNTNEKANSWFELPDKYPSRYYFPTALHGIFALGLKTDLKSKNEKISYWSFYTEISTLDSYIRAFVISNGEVDIKDVWSFSAGLSIRFRK